MKYTISYETILQLRNLTSNCTNLRNEGLEDFTDDLKQGITLLLLTSKRNFLERLQKNNLVTNEISSAAEKKKLLDKMLMKFEIQIKTKMMLINVLEKMLMKFEIQIKTKMKKKEYLKSESISRMWS